MIPAGPRLNHRPAPQDLADTDPATRRARTGEPMGARLPPATQAFLDAPPCGADTDGFFTGWFKKAEQRVQVAPRAPLYAFDPMFMTDPNIYEFERDNQPLPRKFYRQTRTNKAKDSGVRYDSMGSVGKTANGDEPVSIFTIEWEKQSGGVLDFELYDRNTNLIVEGYCKQTDYGGKFKWVAVIVRLHGSTLPADQGPRLLSYPLYGALASGVSFGIWYDDDATQAEFPNMGAGVPRDDEKDLRNAMDRNSRLRSRRRAGIPTAQTKVDESLADGITGMRVATTGTLPSATTVQLARKTSVGHPQGAALASVAQAANANYAAKSENEFLRFTPEGKAEGAGMHVRPSARRQVLGAIYPVHAKIDVRVDGLCITRIKMVETPVKFSADPLLKGVSRYDVELFADGVDAPVGTLSVLPEAYPRPDDASRLKLANHSTKIKVGTSWNIPGAETFTATDEDAALVATNVPAWDSRLVQTIEATMWTLRKQDKSAVAYVPYTL